MIQLKERNTRTCCRLCLSNSSICINIFASNESRPLDDLIEKLTSIKITKHDLLSNNICVGCHYLLTRFHKFQLKVINANKEFNRIIQLYGGNEQNVPQTVEMEVMSPSDDEDTFNVEPSKVNSERNRNSKSRSQLVDVNLQLNNFNIDETDVVSDYSSEEEYNPWRNRLNSSKLFAVHFRKSRNLRKKRSSHETFNHKLRHFDEESVKYSNESKDDKTADRPVISNTVEHVEIFNPSVNKIKEQYPNIILPDNVLHSNFDCYVNLPSFQILIREAFLKASSDKQENVKNSEGIQLKPPSDIEKTTEKSIETQLRPSSNPEETAKGSIGLQLKLPPTETTVQNSNEANLESSFNGEETVKSSNEIQLKPPSNASDMQNLSATTSSSLTARGMLENLPTNQNEEFDDDHSVSTKNAETDFEDTSSLGSVKISKKYYFECEKCKRRYLDSSVLNYHIMICHNAKTELKVLTKQLQIPKRQKGKTVSSMYVLENDTKLRIQYGRFVKIVTLPSSKLPTTKQGGQINNNTLTFRTLSSSDTSELLKKVNPETQISLSSLLASSKTGDKSNSNENSNLVNTTYNHDIHREKMLKRSAQVQKDVDEINYNIPQQGLCQQYLPGNNNTQILANLLNTSQPSIDLTCHEQVPPTSALPPPVPNVNFQPNFYKEHPENVLKRKRDDIINVTTKQSKLHESESVKTQSIASDNQENIPNNNFLKHLSFSTDQLESIIKKNLVQAKDLNDFDTQIINSTVAKYLREHSENYNALEKVVSQRNVEVKYRIGSIFSFNFEESTTENHNVKGTKIKTDWNKVAIIDDNFLNDTEAVINNPKLHYLPHNKPLSIPMLNWKKRPECSVILENTLQPGQTVPPSTITPTSNSIHDNTVNYTDLTKDSYDKSQYINLLKKQISHKLGRRKSTSRLVPILSQPNKQIVRSPVPNILQRHTQPVSTIPVSASLNQGLPVRTDPILASINQQQPVRTDPIFTSLSQQQSVRTDTVLTSISQQQPVRTDTVLTSLNQQQPIHTIPVSTSLGQQQQSSSALIQKPVPSDNVNSYRILNSEMCNVVPEVYNARLLNGGILIEPDSVITHTGNYSNETPKSNAMEINDSALPVNTIASVSSDFITNNAKSLGSNQITNTGEVIEIMEDDIPDIPINVITPSTSYKIVNESVCVSTTDSNSDQATSVIGTSNSYNQSNIDLSLPQITSVVSLNEDYNLELSKKSMTETELDVETQHNVETQQVSKPIQRLSVLSPSKINSLVASKIFKI